MGTVNSLWSSLMRLPTPWVGKVHFMGTPEVGTIVREDVWSEVLFSTPSRPPVPVAGIEDDEGDEVMLRGHHLVTILPPTNRLIIAPVQHDPWQRETVQNPIERIDVRLVPDGGGDDG